MKSLVIKINPEFLKIDKTGPAIILLTGILLLVIVFGSSAVFVNKQSQVKGSAIYNFRLDNARVKIIEYNNILVKSRNKVVENFEELTNKLNETNNLEEIQTSFTKYKYSLDDFEMKLNELQVPFASDLIKQRNEEYLAINYHVVEIVDVLLDKWETDEDLETQFIAYNEQKNRLNNLNHEILNTLYDILGFDSENPENSSKITIGNTADTLQ